MNEHREYVTAIHRDQAKFIAEQVVFSKWGIPNAPKWLLCFYAGLPYIMGSP